MADPTNTDESPCCDKCGAEITTGLMAVFCPLGTECAFWCEEHADWLHELRRNVERGCESRR